MNWEFNKFNKQIINEVNISDVIKEYLILHKRGRDFISICPFHNDKNPSMTISTSKQIFKCFSCGVGGTALKFVVLIENISFVKAYKIIANKFNLKIDSELLKKTNLTKDQKNKLEILEEVNNYYRFNILNPPILLKNFLINRGINDEIIKKYELGWAPKENEKIIEYLIKKGFKESELLKSELFSFNNNKLIDYFKERILFPIKNEDNVLIGFSGRTVNINSKQYSKFLISRDSDIFDKKKILFNLTNIQKDFKNLQKVYLTEGFMDAIRLTELRHPSIAVLGTQIFIEQIGLIKESFKEVIIIPDGDEPGIKSALDSALKLISFKIKVLIFDHKTNLDPDKLFRKNPNYLEENKNSIIHPIEFLINKYKSLQTKEKQNEFVFEVTEFLKFMSEINRDFWLKRIELKFGISYETFKKQLEKNNLKVQKQSNKPKQNDNIFSLNNEEILLSCLFIFPEVRIKFKQIDGIIEKKENEKIINFIFDLYKNKNSITQEKIFELANNLKIKEKVEFLLKNIIIKTIISSTIEQKYKFFNELLNWYKNTKIKKKIVDLKNKMKNSDDSTLLIEYKKLLKLLKLIIFFDK